MKSRSPATAVSVPWFSGGTLERPGLKRLIQDVEAGLIDVIVVAAVEKVSDRFVSGMMRLAYLSPEVLDHLVITRRSPALSLNDLIAVAELPWAGQMDAVFG